MHSHRSPLQSITLSVLLGLLVVPLTLLAGVGQHDRHVAAAGRVTEGATVVHPRETRQLARLYKAALAEGGRVVLWAGGDAPDQMDWFKQAFERRFPHVQMELTVDLSRFHDIRIDAALAEGGELPDVTILQTTFDFDRWKAQGHLMFYRPVGFAQQRPGYADREGAYITAFNNVFLPTHVAGLRGPDAPRSYLDFLEPRFKGRLALTYPHDDDAVLYVYDRLQRRFGEAFLTALAAQAPTFFRGTAVPAHLVGREGFPYLGAITGYPTESDAASIHLVPESDPILVWNQRAAIFRAARHPAAARLLLSWLGSAEFQSSYDGPRARADVGHAPGLEVLESRSDIDVHDFTRWMADRQQVMRLRRQMQALFGPVVGESPLRDPALIEMLGLSPERVVALPEPAQPPY